MDGLGLHAFYPIENDSEGIVDLMRNAAPWRSVIMSPTTLSSSRTFVSRRNRDNSEFNIRVEKSVHCSHKRLRSRMTWGTE